MAKFSEIALLKPRTSQLELGTDDFSGFSSVVKCWPSKKEVVGSSNSYEQDFSSIPPNCSIQTGFQLDPYL